MKTMSMQVNTSPRTALRFVVLLGIVSLFADMTYEGARSITGPYLAVLGASATTVGIVAGFGELIGYLLRLASGYLADRTQRYWLITIIGYAINLLAVPALALAGHWTLAALLIVLERTGKAIRTPARDAMLSHATAEMGRGWGFGLHEALDQAGATVGPLIVAAVLYFKEGYSTAFASLLVPALLALVLLTVARFLYPRPQSLETLTPKWEAKGFGKAYWVYLAAVSCIALGYADYPLIAYHFEKTDGVPSDWIAVFYAVAMAVDALAALVFGYWYDRLGIKILVVAAMLSALFAPLVFLGDFSIALAGVVFWGIGMGAQESIMRAAIAAMSPKDRRGTAYGFFNMSFGLFWFAGSAFMGFLYDISIPALIAFSVAAQLISLPLFIASHRLHRADMNNRPVE
jgi:MFS family permease